MEISENTLLSLDEEENNTVTDARTYTSNYIHKNRILRIFIQRNPTRPKNISFDLNFPSLGDDRQYRFRKKPIFKQIFSGRSSCSGS